MKTFEVIAGTYQEFLIGYNFINSEARLVQSFASHDHTASIRSLTTSSKYLASGGADDRIIIYDFNLRKEHFMLSHHNATINCLHFTPNHSHLLSGSQDGVLSITRVGNWQVEKLWDKAHKGAPVIDIAVHPSGKLALTLGQDCVLRTWNLVKGRQAYAINLRSKSKDAKSLSRICWAKDGVRFILYGGKYTEIWSIETGGILQVIEHEAKISSCIWYSDKKILVGYEDGNLSRIKLSSLKKLTHKVHEDRVKVLARHDEWLVSGSSSGEIKVYDNNLNEICKTNSGCRLTSLTILPPIKIKKEDDDLTKIRKPIEIEDESTIKSKKTKSENVILENTIERDQQIKKRKKNNSEISNVSISTEISEKHKSCKKKKN